MAVTGIIHRQEVVEVDVQANGEVWIVQRDLNDDPAIVSVAPTNIPLLIALLQEAIKP